MKVFYRFSDAGNIRDRIGGSNKISYLNNFLTNFQLNKFDSIFILADKVSEETNSNIEYLVNNKNFSATILRSNANTEAESFRFLLNNFEKSNLRPEEYVYFLEDDFIHLPKSRQVLEEGLLIADYATLWLHPDKFTPPSLGGNPLVDEKGGEATKVYFGGDSFWMLTNSTGMVFATTTKTLLEDIGLWYEAVNGNVSRDFDAFMWLREKGRTLVMPIPTWATHAEMSTLSSLIGTGYCCWDKVLSGKCWHTKAAEKSNV